MTAKLVRRALRQWQLTDGFCPRVSDRLEVDPGRITGEYYLFRSLFRGFSGLIEGASFWLLEVAPEAGQSQSVQWHLGWGLAIDFVKGQDARAPSLTVVV